MFICILPGPAPRETPLSTFSQGRGGGGGEGRGGGGGGGGGGEGGGCGGGVRGPYFLKASG